MVPSEEVRRPSRLMRLPAVMECTSLGKSSIYSKVKTGDFPAPVRLSTRAVAWHEDEISEWVETRVKVPAANAATTGV